MKGGVAGAGPEARAAAARSGLWSLLARALVTPNNDIHKFIEEGGLAAAAGELAAGLPCPIALPEFPAPGPLVEWQAGYIAAFEVGVKGPPCPLYEGAFRKDRGRKAVMEEVLRFYHFFDLKMSEAARELPDQLSAELEFMHCLSFREAELIEREGPDAEGLSGLRRGQRDFLERHLAAWVPGLAAKARKIGAPPTHLALLTLLTDFILSDLDYLNQVMG